MRKFLLFKIAVFLFVVIKWGWPYDIQAPYESLDSRSEIRVGVPEAQIDSMIELLNSEDFLERYSAAWFFYSLPASQKTDKVRLALINALAKEELDRKPVPGEAYAEYSSDLRAIVISLADPRALKIIINPKLRYTSPFTNWFLARMGEEPGVLDTLLHDLTIGHCGPEPILAEIVRPKSEDFTATEDLKDSIKVLLINALHRWRDRVDTTLDREWLRYARADVIRALAKFPDDDVVLILDSIAKNDPYSFKDKEVIKYPVREEAKRALIIHQLIRAGLEEKNKDAYELYVRALPELYPYSDVPRLRIDQIALLDSLSNLYPKTIFSAYALGLLGVFYEDKAKTTRERSLSPEREKLAVEYREKATSYWQKLLRNHLKEEYPPIIEKSNIFIKLIKN